MSKHLFSLDERLWVAIEPSLPKRRRGARQVDGSKFNHKLAAKYLSATLIAASVTNCCN